MTDEPNVQTEINNEQDLVADDGDMLPVSAATEDFVLKALETPSEAVQAALTAMIDKAVKARIAGTTPKRATATLDPITKDQFDKMDYNERVDLYKRSPELYNKLMN